REQIRLGVPAQKRVRRLKRLDGRDPLDVPKLLDGEVRDADVTDDALFLQLCERAPPLLDLLDRTRVVDLIEVDAIRAQAAQAALCLGPDRVAREAPANRSGRPREDAAFREDVRTRVHAVERAADDLLRMAEAVRRSGVDPVDAEFERVSDRRDRVL